MGVVLALMPILNPDSFKARALVVAARAAGLSVHISRGTERTLIGAIGAA